MDMVFRESVTRLCAEIILPAEKMKGDGMMDYAELARQAVAFIYSHEASAVAAGVGANAITDFLKNLFHGKPAEKTLEAARQDPPNKEAIEALQAQLAELLEKDAKARSELAELLRTQTKASSTKNVTIIGKNIKIAKNKGDSATFNM